MTKREATDLIRGFYEAQTPNPEERRACVNRITISIEEDEEGDCYWHGAVHDLDGTSVEFSMPDHYPEGCYFDY